MREYNLINRCLVILKGSRIDVMTKLRIENLLIGIKMLLLAEVLEESIAPDLEELSEKVTAVCNGGTAEGVSGLLEYVRKLRSSMADCLDLGC
ncbi:hypothetical protein L4X63_20215 [Geomonas sp. Red32]|uniref:hypothetical protein n=1 Tax=Geomonas sp. Red32 TaxID=2912856 RepID=UPI00202CD9DD|nr:hypothetical protein [Geomonas sp. Red32]MCM0083911.1 hypothetical protein [Geomonas sp. Red32]